MRASEELRSLLNKLGVEWHSKHGYKTMWQMESKGVVSKFSAWETSNGDLTLTIEDVPGFTPKEAIVATIERTCKNEWARYGKFRCSKCWLQIDAISTNTTQPMLIRYCPNCGRKVVHE